jgi:hypothetical protein
MIMSDTLMSAANLALPVTRLISMTALDLPPSTGYGRWLTAQPAVMTDN